MSISDHSLVYCTLKTGVRKASPKVSEYRSYKSFNADSFINDIENIPRHVVENETNIDDAVITWNKLFSDVADAHAPIKNRRISGRAGARTLIGGGGGGCIFIYSGYARLISFEINFITKETSRTEPEYMNIHPPPN